MIKLLQEKKSLVFGCGNSLFGDDGFGPEVIECLDKNYTMPDHVACMDVGTSIRDILFDILLLDDKPDQIVIIDAAENEGRKPGEIFEIDVDEISPLKINDFSLHQFPTTNMLKELKDDTDIDVRILVAQITALPTEVAPGISEPVQIAIPEMAQRVFNIIQKRR